MDSGLLGREVELVAVDTALTKIASGLVALFFEGEPGIGKTTVWREAVRRAGSGGFAVLSCRPAESERKLSFAALADLLEGVPPAVFDSLPGPQRRALEVALLQAESEDSPADPRAVAAGFRGILLALAERSPVLIAIDDTQWLDAPSARARWSSRCGGSTALEWGCSRPGVPRRVERAIAFRLRTHS